MLKTLLSNAIQMIIILMIVILHSVILLNVFCRMPFCIVSFCRTPFCTVSFFRTPFCTASFCRMAWRQTGAKKLSFERVPLFETKGQCNKTFLVQLHNSVISQSVCHNLISWPSFEEVRLGACDTFPSLIYRCKFRSLPLEWRAKSCSKQPSP